LLNGFLFNKLINIIFKIFDFFFKKMSMRRLIESNEEKRKQFYIHYYENLKKQKNCPMSDAPYIEEELFYFRKEKSLFKDNCKPCKQILTSSDFVKMSKSCPSLRYLRTSAHLQETKLDERIKSDVKLSQIKFSQNLNGDVGLDDSSKYKKKSSLKKVKQFSRKVYRIFKKERKIVITKSVSGNKSLKSFSKVIKQESHLKKRKLNKESKKK
jgi:hypothetical protein